MFPKYDDTSSDNNHQKESCQLSPTSEQYLTFNNTDFNITHFVLLMLVDQLKFQIVSSKVNTDLKTHKIFERCKFTHLYLKLKYTCKVVALLPRSFKIINLTKKNLLSKVFQNILEHFHLNKQEVHTLL